MCLEQTVLWCAIRFCRREKSVMPGSRIRAQQYIIQSTIPISSVAATTPNTMAARSVALPPLSFMTSWPPIGVRLCLASLVGLLAACAEPTTSVRRFAILDEIGTSDWQTVTVGGEHTCAIKTTGAAYCWGSNQYGQLALARLDTMCGT